MVYFIIKKGVAQELNKKGIKKYFIRNTFCGTYEYMSPEVVNKLNYQESVDIWSLGILLYELIHGVTPFNARTHLEIMNRIKTKEIGKIFIISLFSIYKSFFKSFIIKYIK